MLPCVNVVRCGPRDQVPVVLIHAVGLDLTYWDRQIATLSKSHDVVVFYLPGHGRSPGAPADWTLDKAETMLAGVIRATGAQRPHLLGLSVGGMIAQAAALAHPALVGSLTLMDTAASFAEAGRAGLRKRAKATRPGKRRAAIHARTLVHAEDDGRAARLD